MSTTLLTPRITADQVTCRLMLERYARGFIIPRFTPAGWWETDAFFITKAGYWVEFEVKLTRGDFKADAQKTQNVRGTGRWEPDPSRPGHQHYVHDQERKHDLMAQTDRGPCQFFYVCPEQLVTLAELPAWAGLICFFEVSGRNPPYNLGTRVVLPAPRRHKLKADPSIRAQALTSIYWRWHKGDRP
jgi:hypothetical protein